MSSILLSSQEVEDLKRMCNDPFLELGMTLRPKHLECFKPKIVTHNMEVIILFKEHADAEKWNRIHEARIRKGGHLATISLTVLVQMIGGNPAASIAIGSTAGILKDEVQAQFWYPKMFKGWVLTRYFNFRYEQFPRQNFYMSWSDVIQDETGKEIERRKHGQSHCTVGESFGIPEKLVRKLMTQYPLHTSKFK